jgi:hypothetical protein
MVPVPGRVFVPIIHDHETLPVPSACLATRPCAVLLVPAGVVYAMEQLAPACVVARSVAVWPGRIGLVINVMVGPAGGGGVLVGT